MRRPRFAGLVLKLSWVGLSQLVIVLGAALLTSVLVARYWVRWDLPAVMDRIEPVAQHTAELRQKLREMRAAGGPELSIYDGAGALIASNVTPPLQPPEFTRKPPPFGPHPQWTPPGPLGVLLPSLLGEPPAGPFRHRHAAVRLLLEHGEGTLVMRRQRESIGPWPLVLTLLSGALAVGVGAVLTARFVVKPLLNVEKELMANVAHELRTPLSRIRVALEIAGEGDAATARSSLEEIAVDLAELETLIDDVLTAARLDLASGTARSALPLSFKAVPAREIAEDAAARFRARHPSRALSLALADGPLTLNADAVLLRRALDNLLENADKYTHDPDAPVALSLARRAELVCFEVQDRGIGMTKSDLERVFSPFFRAERSRTRNAGGVGLGLTLAKQIVEAHGGRIRLSSAPGSGTTAEMQLPCS